MNVLLLRVDFDGCIFCEDVLFKLCIWALGHSSVAICKDNSLFVCCFAESV